MNNRFKEFVRTPRGKLFIALIAMIVSWIFLLWNFSGSTSLALPSEKRKNTVKQEIRRLRSEVQSQEVKFKDADKVKKRHKNLIESSWQPVRDGDPELVLRQKIESAAKECELKLNSIGTVRITRITQDFYFAELDISANAPFETIIKFIAKIQEIKPVISWRRLSANLMFQRPRPNTPSQTVTNASAGNISETTLIFSGNLRVVVYDDGSSAQKDAQKKEKSDTPGETGTPSAKPQPVPENSGPGPAPGPPPPPPSVNPVNEPPPAKEETAQ
ncbi:MAG: hypothetical protein BWY31_00108 [Lentisphaerae bacterium ADurb.Bin242]|nr:MAG: hypothetical protein BWY31_00108 [Lentisphaerae bacterium ADurb.Bin242]